MIIIANIAKYIMYALATKAIITLTSAATAAIDLRVCIRYSFEFYRKY